MFNQQLTVGKFKSNILRKKYETNLVFLSKIKSGSDSLLCNRKLWFICCLMLICQLFYIPSMAGKHCLINHGKETSFKNI